MILLSFSSMVIYAQEDCTNGIDDDGDGFIDLHDSECVCGNVTNNTIVGDFEDYSCCPTMFTSFDGDGIYCLEDGWGPASTGTSDYFNTCGYMGGTSLPMIPTPIPSGEGAVGFISGNTYYENVGYCIGNNAMISGDTYTLSFYIGFHEDEGWSSDLDIDISLFGTEDCANFPETELSIFCQDDFPNWEELTVVDVMGVEDDSWLYVEHTFVCTMNAAAIAIGIDCPTSVGSNYHFLDDIQLSGNFLLEEVADDISSSGDCVDGVTLEIPSQGGATYQWYLDGIAITGATNSTYTIPTADDEGMYQVMVINGSWCAISPEFEVLIDSDVLDIEGIITAIQCVENMDGIIDITPDGDNFPFEFEWSDGSSSEDILNGVPGSYTVTVTDANGCFGSETFTLEPPDLIDIELSGDCATGVYIEVDDGLNLGMYQWFLDGIPVNGAVTNPYNVPTTESGEYTVQVSNGTQCLESNPLQVDIESEVLVIDGDITDLLCFGIPTGSIDLTVNTINLPYEIEWDNGEGSELITGLEAGNYIVTVTDDNGCFGVNLFVVDEPDLFLNSITIVQPDMGIPGGASIQSAGGVMPYTYQWSNGNNTSIDQNLPPGAYSITVTDDNGCIEIFEFEIIGDFIVIESIVDESCSGTCDGSASLTIDGPDVVYSIAWEDPSLSGFVVQDLCAGNYAYTVTDDADTEFLGVIEISEGEGVSILADYEPLLCSESESTDIALSLSGGALPYDILWEDGSISDTLHEVFIGIYSVTVTDDNGCIDMDTFEIVGLPSMEILYSTIPTGCMGEEDGAIDLTVSGGLSPYDIVWSNGELTEDIDSLSSGTYTVSVTDMNNCIVIDSIILNSNSGIEVDIDIVNENCVGEGNGAISLNVSGGTAPYDIIWNDGSEALSLDSLPQGLYTVTISDATGCSFMSSIPVEVNSEISITSTFTDNDCFGDEVGTINLEISNALSSYIIEWNNGQTTEDLSGLSAGSYTYTLIDSFGCEYMDEFVILEGVPLNYETVISEPGCNGGEDGLISLSLTSGEVPVSYVWSTGDTTNQITNISSGIYYISITDNAGCETIDTFLLEEQSDIITEIDVVHVDCFGDSTGNIEVLVNGGVEPYSYEWSNGESTSFISGLEAGSYEVNISDLNNCSVIQIVDITQPESITISETLDVPQCFGEQGAIDLEVSGGVSPYTFLWSTGSMDSSILLDAGEFAMVTVTGSVGCIASMEYSFDVISAININIESVTNPTSSNDDGAISISVSGGSAPYDVTWDNGLIGVMISGLSIGSYIAEVEDSNGCVESITINIGSQPLTYSDTILQNVCYGECEGQISLAVSGGVEPYTVSWSNGSLTDAIADLCNGAYQATILDNLGSEVITEELEITSPSAIVIDGQIYDISCVDADDGSVSLDIEGGEEPFNFDWSNDMAGDSIANLAAGIYSVTAVDDYGCEETALYTIDDIPLVDLSVDLEEYDCGLSFREISISGDNTFNYPIFINQELAVFSEDNTISELTAGTYLLSYAINESCVIPLEEVIIDPIPEFVLTFNTELIEVVEGEVAIVTLETFSNSINTYQIDWTIVNDYSCIEIDSFGNCVSLEVLATTSETIVVNLMDNYGCEHSSEIELRVSDRVDEVFIPNVFSPDGDGVNDVFKLESTADDLMISKFYVFDRWGNNVHSQHLINKEEMKWDGRYRQQDLSSGVYVYYILANINEKEEVFIGDLTLIR